MNPQAPGNSFVGLLPILAMFLIFYFVWFRPMKRDQEEDKKKLAALKKNDGVVTAGGIHGTVVNVKEKTVVVRVDDSVKLEFDKSAIVRVESAA